MKKLTRRHRMTPQGKVYFTAEEELARDAEEQEWLSLASSRESDKQRETRNNLLGESDWTQMPDAPLTEEEKTLWQTYRQALRDVTAQAGFPNDITWPTQPE
jgi:hypothetical protein